MDTQAEQQQQPSATPPPSLDVSPPAASPAGYTVAHTTESTATDVKQQRSSGSGSRRDWNGTAAGGAGGMALGSAFTLTFGVLLPKLIGQARRRRARAQAARVKKAPDAPATPAPQAQPQPTVDLQPFGSPCSTHTPSTPCAKLPATQASSDAQGADDAHHPDQDRAPPPSSKQESAEALKQQLKLLSQMQEENAKLRAFMEAHLASSQKAVTLESENETLKAAKQALEAELETLRKPAAPVMLELNNGDELERFKRGLPGGNAHAAPTHAQSVCSDANGNAGAPSIDGTPSVGAATDMAATRPKQPGVVSDFVKWMRSSSNNGPRGAVAPPRPSNTGTSRAGSMRSEQAATPRATSMQPSKSNADVTQLLDAWTGANPTPVVL